MWTGQVQANAKYIDGILGGLPGIQIPRVPPDRTHVYYQYCVYGAQRDELVVRCVRRGVDIETLHVDVCSDLDLFAGATVVPPGAPGARRAAAAPETPSPARSRQAPAPPHFQGPFSWLQNHLRNISRNDTQNAGRASCHRWCRDARAVDRALSGAAQDPRHPAECKK